MRRLTFADIERARTTRGESALLFITDRCPVGCGHCSVDSRPDSPKISDFTLFGEVVESICAGTYTIVGISGGEPFVERRGLDHASRRLVESGKEVVIYTSGFWAGSADPPSWIPAVLRRASAVVLSTDSFHQAALADDRFVRAAKTIAAEQVHIVVQVIDDETMIGRAQQLLATALGPAWADAAEIHPIPMLPYGRADGMLRIERTQPGTSYLACHIARAPVIRYDGLLSVCCNEWIITGHGPDDYRRVGSDRHEVTAALAELEANPLFRAIGDIGPGPLTMHPALADLAQKRYRSICELCWDINSRVRAGTADIEPFLVAATRIGTEALR